MKKQSLFNAQMQSHFVKYSLRTIELDTMGDLRFFG